MLWIKHVLGHVIKKTALYIFKKWRGKSTNQPQRCMPVTVTLGVSGQLEVIGKLDALAKSLRSSEVWEMSMVGCFLVPGFKVGSVAYNIYNPPEGNIYI